MAFPQNGESVTHVSGMKCYPQLRKGKRIRQHHPLILFLLPTLVCVFRTIISVGACTTRGLTILCTAWCNSSTVFVRVSAVGIGLVHERSLRSSLRTRVRSRTRILANASTCCLGGIDGLTAHTAEIGPLLLGHLPVVEAVSADQIAQGDGSRSAGAKQIGCYVEYPPRRVLLLLTPDREPMPLRRPMCIIASAFRQQQFEPVVRILLPKCHGRSTR